MGLSDGFFMPQSLMLTNSSLESCMMFRELNYINSCNYFMNYTHEDELTCGFSPMEYKGNSKSDDDILREN